MFKNLPKGEHEYYRFLFAFARERRLTAAELKALGR